MKCRFRLQLSWPAGSNRASQRVGTWIGIARHNLEPKDWMRYSPLTLNLKAVANNNGNVPLLNWSWKQSRWPSAMTTMFGFCKNPSQYFNNELVRDGNIQWQWCFQIVQMTIISWFSEIEFVFVHRLLGYSFGLLGLSISCMFGPQYSCFLVRQCLCHGFPQLSYLLVFNVLLSGLSCLVFLDFPLLMFVHGCCGDDVFGGGRWLLK